MKKRLRLIRLPAMRGMLSLGLMAFCTSAFAERELPPLMQVPGGNAIALTASAKGHVTYVCQTIHTDGTRPAWTLRSALANWDDPRGAFKGAYSSPPERWKSADGSTLTGMETVRAPSGSDQLYDQLVLANPSSGVGQLTGVTYIQRLVRAGGAPPRQPCSQSNMGVVEQVPYEADYVFWKPQ